LETIDLGELATLRPEFRPEAPATSAPTPSQAVDFESALGGRYDALLAAEQRALESKSAFQAKRASNIQELFNKAISQYESNITPYVETSGERTERVGGRLKQLEEVNKILNQVYGDVQTARTLGPGEAAVRLAEERGRGVRAARTETGLRAGRELQAGTAISGFLSQEKIAALESSSAIVRQKIASLGALLTTKESDPQKEEEALAGINSLKKKNEPKMTMGEFQTLRKKYLQERQKSSVEDFISYADSFERGVRDFRTR
jgi:hypothetical protein